MLGAGGVLGASWTIGALNALSSVLGFEGRDAEAIVGTSAGSVLAAYLGRGLTHEEMVGHRRNDEHVHEAAGKQPSAGDEPPSPRWGTVGSPKLLAAAARRPGSVSAGVAVSAMLPEGRGSLEPIGRLVRGASGEEPSWPTALQLWIVATDFETGRRTVFGRADAPEASVSEAVMASCAIPSWYRPMIIGGRRYVDGGTCSTTSADVLAKLELDEVYVLAPMASFELDCPSSPLARLERQLRRATTKRLSREVSKLQAVGTKVITLVPGPEDLAVIGTNLMDPRRRADVYQTSQKTSEVALRSLATRRDAGLPAAG